MLNTVLYGLFNKNGQIQEELKSEIQISTTQNIFIENFDSFKNNDETLYFSGVLYNKSELEEFLGLKSNNEAEILYLLFAKENYNGFKRINGKFLIIIQSETSTIVARDRYGQGPMFYYNNECFTNQFYQLQDFKSIKFEPNTTALGNYLMYSYIPSPISSIKNINKLAGGDVLIKEGNSFKLEPLFPFADFASNRITIDENEALEEYDRLFKLSIKRRIGEHQTMGALLSGGYDSGGNISTIPEVYNGKIKTYSIGFKDNPFSELPYARMMAEKFGAEHHEYLMDGSEIEDLPFLVRNLGDPFSESGWMLNNSAMKLVHDKQLPVVLGGDGSDQLFTAALREVAYRYKFKKNMLAPAQKLFAGFAENSFFEKDNIFFKARFHNDKILNILAPDHFGFRKYQTQKLLNTSFEPHPTLNAIPKKFDTFDELFNIRNYFVDIKQNSTEVILFKASRVSQMYGVNLAFTYIDEDVIKFIKSLPRNLKAKGSIDDLASGKGVSKYLLKAMIKPKLPEEVTSRKKQGGFSPLQMFFMNDLRRLKIYEFILKSKITGQFLNKKQAQKFFDAYEASTKGEYWFWYKQTMANRLINILVLSLWWEIFMENNYKTKLSEYIGT
jgi:asparagine synthase (glutamine-hydrolysing)